MPRDAREHARRLAAAAGGDPFFRPLGKEESRSKFPTRLQRHAPDRGRVVMQFSLSGIGRAIAQYLNREEAGYEPFTPSDPDALRAVLKPGDVLLVEGNNHVSGVIKYLTQSTWSHAALYVGPIGDRELRHLIAQRRAPR